MSHYDENSAVPGARGPGSDDERLPDATRSAANADSELTELRRNLLLYGTAGQAARMEVRAS
jgi:hypothetical protein